MRKKNIRSNPKKFWLLVILTMLVVAGLWAFWFYPQSTVRLGTGDPRAYAEFKSRLNQAFSLFRKNRQANNDNNKISDEVQELRQRVFGDSIKRFE